ncbi:MAG: efflux RND transporter permease subunit [Gammaproteobacteria bacterium]
MNPARWLQTHRRSLLFLLAVLAIGGAVSAFQLPVSLFPHVQFPRVVVSLDAGDRPADQMELQVTRPMEMALRSIPGVRSVRSNTSRGSADISVNFDWGDDMVSALLQVEAAVNQTLSQVPGGTSFTARRMDPTVFPVIAYSLTSDSLSQVELRDIARYRLLPELSAVAGVGHVHVMGGREAEYRVSVQPARLEALGLTVSDVARAVSAASVLSAVGRLEDHYRLYLTVADSRPQDIGQIRNLVVGTADDGPVRLSDVATVGMATRPQWRRVTADGRDAVLLQVYQQPGANTVKIDRDIASTLAGMESALPGGVKVHKWYDQSELVLASAGSVRDAIIIGIVLAGLVLWLFLRSWRIAVIAVTAVPVVLAITILLLRALGLSFNIMTLGGMAAAVGLIIDDVIVMVEHIARRLAGSGSGHQGRVMQAAREFTRPLVGSSASTVIIFLPLTFLGGVTGSFFRALSLTMAAALAISFFVAWIAVPLLADHLLGAKEAALEQGGRIATRVLDGYRRLLRGAVARPAWVLAAVAVLAGLGYLGYRQVGTGFMPTMDEGGFILDYRAPPGTSLTETDRLLRQVGDILDHTPEVATYSRRTGAQLGGGLTEANEGDFFVKLKPLPRRPIEAVMDDVREQVEHKVPGLSIEMAQLMEDLIGDLTAVPQPVEIKLFGNNDRQLLHLAPRVAAKIARVGGIVDVNDGVILAGDALNIKVDRTRAALAGLDADSVTQQLRALLDGTVAAKVQKGVKFVGVRVWIPGDMRASARRIGNLRLRAADGHRVRVSRVADIETVTGQPQITRENLQRMVAVTARISGRDLGSTIRDVKAVLAQKGLLPQGVYVRLGGLYRQQQIAFRGLTAVFAAAIALVFTLLLFLYESFRVALSIMVAPLLAAAAVFIGLWLTGTELNITSMMGLTMIIGIVTEVGIFYFSEYVDLIEHMPPDQALIEAGANRLRPIALTTLAAILALLPLALGLGQGAAMQQPLAIAIISGLVVQVALVLVAVPVLYGRWRAWGQA